MNKWINPSELPEHFHGSCWVSKKDWYSGKIWDAKLLVVQNHYRGDIPEYYSDNGGWEYLSDEAYRVIPLEKPDAMTEGDWV